MTAHELLRIAREGRPTVRYAMNAKGTAIGAWSDELGRYVTVAGLLITGTGQWASMPYELLVNGQPIPNEWIES